MEILFEEGNQYPILHLKQSKTDVSHTGVQSILSATDPSTWSVLALRRSFVQDFQPASKLLVRLSFSSFSWQNIVSILEKRIAKVVLLEKTFQVMVLGKSAAHCTSDRGMLDSSIQKLGRWFYNAFKLDFTTTLEALFNVNLSFQKDIPLAILQAIISILDQNKPLSLSIWTNMPVEDTNIFLPVFPSMVSHPN